MSRTYKDAPNRIKLARVMEHRDEHQDDFDGWVYLMESKGKNRFTRMSRKQRERLAIRFELQNN